MATVVPSDLAPAEDLLYILGGVDFELGVGGSYETDDRDVLANAEVHPWLKVEYDESEAPITRFRPGTVAPEDDVLGKANSIAFDPEEVQKAADAAAAEVTNPVAIEAGLDQGEVVASGGVAFTHAAADEAEADADKPAPQVERIPAPLPASHDDHEVLN